MKLFILLLSFCHTSVQRMNTQQIASNCNIVVLNTETLSIYKVDFSNMNSYVGKINYTIPTYVIADNDFSDAVVLKYTNGNGIRPNELAFNVGLKWKFSYTDMVSRTIRGLADG